MTSAQVLSTTLRELMTLHAPHARLLADLNGSVWQIGGGEAPQVCRGRDLIPPDAWLEGGELVQLTRGGALLGLMWSGDLPISSQAAEVMTMLLQAARADGGDHATRLLLSQLPTPVALLDESLNFLQVSRQFLELHALTARDVLGQPVSGVFPARTQLPALLARALEGRPVQLPAEYLPGCGCWLRGEAKPFFTGRGAGVLWLTQDASQEQQLAGQLDALLGEMSALLALMDRSGTVQNASRALLDLAAGGTGSTGSGGTGLGSTGPGSTGEQPVRLSGQPFWHWPCWSPEGREAVRALVARAAAGTGAVSADVPLTSGGLLRVRLSGVQDRPLLAAECRDLHAQREEDERYSMQGYLLSEILARSGVATLLLSAHGSVTLANEEAARLLGTEVSSLTGANLAQFLARTGVRSFGAGGEPLDFQAWQAGTLPREEEVTVVSGGVRRTLRLTVNALPTSPETTRTPAAGSSTARITAASTPTVSAAAALASGQGGIIIHMRDVSALRRIEARLRHDSLHDSLTGLLNRSGLQTWNRAQPEGQPPEFVVLSIDGFTSLAAALGRAASDALLVQLAARLQNAQAAQLARLGDGSFALAFSEEPGRGRAAGHPPHSQTEALLDELRRLLLTPFRVGGRAVPVSFSLGASGQGVQAAPGTLSGRGGHPAELLLSQAELALTHAGNQGRGHSALYSEHMQTGLALTFRLQSELPLALSGEQFALSYQPVVALSDLSVVGAEALLRWNHPELGQLHPSSFLPLATRSPIIGEIGEWVVRSALASRAQWPQAPRVTVNLSPDELLIGDLERLLPLLQQEGVPDFELSSSSLHDPSGHVAPLLTRLHELGARLYVDDFGDEYSSLTMLERYPLSGLKLHRSFVARLPEERAVRLLEGTTALASRLGLQVTAVGVETEVQLAALRAAGVNAAQGYLFAAPMNAEEFRHWLEARA